MTFALVALTGLVLGSVNALPANGTPGAAAPSVAAPSAATWGAVHVSTVAQAQRLLQVEAGEGGETLALYAVTTAAAEVDLPPAGGSPGDFVLSEQRLFMDRELTQPAGDAAVRFEFGLTTVTTAVTVRTEGGKIMVDGSQFGQQDSVLAITGGTGQYLGASGVVMPFDLPGGLLLLLLRVIR